MGKSVSGWRVGCQQIHIGIVRLVARCAIANFEISSGLIAAIDQAVTIGFSRRKSGHHSRLQNLLASIHHQRQFTFNDVDKLVLARVPVAQSGGATRLQRHQVDAKVGQSGCIANSFAAAACHLSAKWCGIACACGIGNLMRINYHDERQRYSYSERS